MPPVREDYASYQAARWVRRTTCQLLASLAAQEVAGLSAVILTEASRMARGRTHRLRGKRYATQSCLGFYYPARRSDPAAIFLLVDNIVRSRPWWVWWLPFSKHLAGGSVLFHEVGHHLNATIGTLARGEEASANAWKRRLIRRHARRRYWYLRPVSRPLKWGLRMVIRSFGRRLGSATEKSSACYSARRMREH